MFASLAKVTDALREDSKEVHSMLTRTSLTMMETVAQLNASQAATMKELHSENMKTQALAYKEAHQELLELVHLVSNTSPDKKQVE